MSKRFGRNQKRRMRQEIAELDATANRLREMANNGDFNTRVLLDECKLAIDIYKRIGWADDCDAIRRIENAFSHLRGHYIADVYKKKLAVAAAEKQFLYGDSKPGDPAPRGLLNGGKA